MIDFVSIFPSLARRQCSSTYIRRAYADLLDLHVLFAFSDVESVCRAVIEHCVNEPIQLAQRVSRSAEVFPYLRVMAFCPAHRSGHVVRIIVPTLDLIGFRLHHGANTICQNLNFDEGLVIE